MLRRVAQLALLALIAGIALRAWWPAVETRPIRVFGPSMAPTLLGVHDTWACVDCGYRFATGADDVDLGDRPAVCPNCDRRQPPLAKSGRQPGDRLLIDTLDTRVAAPKRWETIVFRSPESAQQLSVQQHCIKRVVGLPGETVEVRGGDVWIGGVRARKTLAQQHALAIPVHDRRFQPHETADVPQRWKPTHKPSGWTADGAGYRFRVPGASRAPPQLRSGTRPNVTEGSLTEAAVDWLQYTHWRRSADPTRLEPSAVMDDYAYNRGESRRLNRVDDLLLVALLKTAGAGKLCFRGAVAGHEYVVQFDPQRGSGRLCCDGEVVSGSEFSIGQDGHGALLANPSQIEFSLVDHQVLLAINGRLLVTYVCPDTAAPSGTAAAGAAASLAIGAAGLAVDITALTLLRDVYYIDPPRPAAVTLGQDEYYVLGDNSPLSADSRTGWPGAGLPGHNIVGTLRGQ